MCGCRFVICTEKHALENTLLTLQSVLLCNASFKNTYLFQPCLIYWGEIWAWWELCICLFALLSTRNMTWMQRSGPNLAKHGRNTHTHTHPSRLPDPTVTACVISSAHPHLVDFPSTSDNPLFTASQYRTSGNLSDIHIRKQNSDLCQGKVSLLLSYWHIF